MLYRSGTHTKNSVCSLECAVTSMGQGKLVLPGGQHLATCMHVLSLGAACQSSCSSRKSVYTFSVPGSGRRLWLSIIDTTCLPWSRVLPQTVVSLVEIFEKQESSSSTLCPLNSNERRKHSLMRGRVPTFPSLQQQTHPLPAQGEQDIRNHGLDAVSRV